MGVGTSDSRLSAPDATSFCCTNDSNRLVSFEARTPESGALAAALSVAEAVAPASPSCSRPGRVASRSSRDGDAGSSVHPEGRYRDWGPLRRALSTGDVVLIRGDYIERLWRKGGVLLKRQELPPEAIWDAEELLLDVNDRRRPTPRLLSISYGWISKEHPDPDAFHLKTFAPLLVHFAESSKIGVENLALFIDWCSLPQLPRSNLEAAAHRRALHQIDLWYAHAFAHVWLLTQVPGSDQAPYSLRGWTKFERALASMIKPPEAVVDLGLLRPGWTTWSDVTNECRARRRPPELPEAFNADLRGKIFTFPEDGDFVMDKYREVFHRVVASTELFQYSELGWGDSEVQELATLLPLCARLRELDLQNNRIGPPGAAALADVVPRCEALNKLLLENNFLSEDAVKALERSWVASEKPKNGLGVSSQHRWAKAPMPTGVRDRSIQLSGSHLNALLARQAAFEARIDTAMRRLSDNLHEVTGAVGSASGGTGESGSPFHQASSSAQAWPGLQAVGADMRSGSLLGIESARSMSPPQQMMQPSPKARDPVTGAANRYSRSAGHFSGTPVGATTYSNFSFDGGSDTLLRGPGTGQATGASPSVGAASFHSRQSPRASPSSLGPSVHDGYYRSPSSVASGSVPRGRSPPRDSPAPALTPSSAAPSPYASPAAAAAAAVGPLGPESPGTLAAARAPLLRTPVPPPADLAPRTPRAVRPPAALQALARAALTAGAPRQATEEFLASSSPASSQLDSPPPRGRRSSPEQ